MCEKCVEKGSKINKETIEIVEKYGPRLKKFREQMMKEVSEEYRKNEPTQKGTIDVSGHAFICMLTGWAMSEEINEKESIIEATSLMTNLLMDGVECSRAYQFFKNKRKH